MSTPDVGRESVPAASGEIVVMLPAAGGPAGPELASRPASVLEEEREFFLRSLRDLEAEHDVGDIDDADYQALKDDYTVRAAAVLRQLAGVDDAPEVAAQDGGGAPSVAEDDQPVAERPRSPRRRRWLIGAAAAVVLGSLGGWALTAGSSNRQAGQTISGAPVGAEKIADLLSAAQSAAAKGDAVTALKDCRAILAEDPTQAQALAEEGWVLAQTQAASLQTEGLADLTRAEALSPGDRTTRLYRGITLLDMGRKAAAVSDLQWYLSHGPDPAVKAKVEAALAEAEKAAAAGQAPSSPTTAAP